MYLKTVKIKNFRGYGQDPTREDGFFVYGDLDRPFVIFHGFNGHGKTSFFEAIEWCLTDTVSRLVKMYRQGGGAYGAHELNRSHYLKFSRPDDPIRDREIVVELEFDDGTRVTRRSTSQILGISGSSSYGSTLVYHQSGAEPQFLTTEKLLELLIPRSEDRSDVLRAHMLGQDSLTDLLRHTEPEERKKLFMRLLQQEKLSNYIGRLDSHLAPASQMRRQPAKLQNDIKEIRVGQQKIDEYFKNIGQLGFLEYRENFRKSYVKLRPFIEYSARVEEIELGLLERTGDHISGKDCVRLLRGVSKTQLQVQRKVEEYKAHHTEMVIIQGHVDQLRLLDQAMTWLRREAHAKLLYEGNLKEIQAQLKELQSGEEKVSKDQKQVEGLIKQLEGYEAFYQEMPGLIDLQEKKVEETFWIWVQNAQVRREQFIKIFQGFLQESARELSSWKHQELRVWEEQEKELQNLRTETQLNYNRVVKMKETASSLNTDYKNVLTELKQYVLTHAEGITACPVCLNDDFSSDFYQTLLEGEQLDSIPDQLTALIDRTMSSGDAKIAEYGKEESVLKKQWVEFGQQIETLVLQPMQMWLRNILQEIGDQIRFVKNKLVERQVELRTEAKKIQNQKKSYIQQKELMTESILMLYGDIDPESELDVQVLEQILLEKERWFVQHLPQLGFDHIPTPDELLNQIRAVHGENRVAEFYPDRERQLQELRQKNTRYLRFFAELEKRLQEIEQFEVPTDYEEVLERYEQLEADIKGKSQLKDVLDACLKQVSERYDLLTQRQTEILGTQIQGHPVITWVYSMINPHAHYQDLQIKIGENGAHFSSSGIKKDLYLDQIFSQSQMNILALSVFLGLGITQQISNLHQLFLDDPIQSMDDLNVLAFIDVLRAVLDSNHNKKRIILSTHDDNFAELLSIKMRNKDVVHYRIEGYGLEGPRIQRIP